MNKKIIERLKLKPAIYDCKYPVWKMEDGTLCSHARIGILGDGTKDPKHVHFLKRNGSHEASCKASVPFLVEADMEMVERFLTRLDRELGLLDDEGPGGKQVNAN